MVSDEDSGTHFVRGAGTFLRGLRVSKARVLLLGEAADLDRRIQMDHIHLGMEGRICPAQDESPSAPLKFLPGKKPCATFQGCVVTEQATMRKTLKCKGSVVTQIRHVSFVIVYVILLTGRRRQAKDRVILAGRTGTLLNKLF